MRIKFWGVRGSIPCPGAETVRYGGNTACIEIYIESINRRIIIDAGSGIRQLGNNLMAGHAGKNGVQAEVFLTHTHWDHIMGFPFFMPLYLPDSQITIYGPATYEEETLEEVLSGQWTYRYFPVRHEELSSNIQYKELKEGEYDLGQGLQLRTKYLNHPLLCLGYRFEFQGKVFCTAYDTEPFSNVFTTDPDDPSYDAAMAAEGRLAAEEENQNIESFIQGADMLLYDAQYTQAEYDQSRKGWGHSPIEHAIAVSKRNQVKNLILFHHDVMRTDDELDSLSEQHCMPDRNEGMKTVFAREGMQIVI